MKKNIQLELSDEAKTFIAESAFDPGYGARPLKRYLQRHLETQLARSLLGGQVADGAHITVGVKNGELDIESSLIQ